MTARGAVAMLTLAALVACDAVPSAEPQAGIEDIAIDWSADPCYDFYQFACGNWGRWHPIRSENTSASRVRNVQDAQIEALFHIVDDAAFGGPTHPDDPFRTLIGDFDGSCLDAAKAVTPSAVDLTVQLQDVVQAVTSADLASVLARLRMAGVAVGFVPYVDRDPDQPARDILHLWDGGTTMSREYYLDPDLAEYRNAYRQHIEELTAAVAPRSGVVLEMHGDAVLRVETALATAALSDVTARDPYATYHLTPLADLRALTPHFDWDSFFAAGAIPPPAEVNVVNPGFLVALDGIVQSTPLAELRAYLAWRVIEHAAPALGSAVADVEFRFHDRLFEGRTAPLPAYWSCFVDTLGALDFAVSRPFVAERFDAAKRAAATRVLESIRGAMASTIAARPWLDDSTRAAADAKLSSMTAKIGFPDVWPSYADLELGRSGYLANRTALARWRWRHAIERLAVPADRGRWLMAPFETNAYYSQDQNDIVFPAGILQPPFFEDGRPAAVNYGAIGSIMGHEITHGFDDQGRKYDGTGRLLDWWTPAVATEFSTRAACLVDRYDAYEPQPGIHIDGALTLGENLADLGGLKLAYDAFHSPDGGDGVGAPGFFTPDQQFFIAFAQDWCQNVRPESEADRLRTDPHSPPRYRVNGTVANVEAFATAFHCDAGTPLGRADRCQVW